MESGSILLVEDERINALAFKKGLENIHATNPLIVHETAESALSFLNDTKELPAIIILDLNLPKMNGIDFLRIVKKDERLKRIPVIVLTTSTSPKDKTDCFNLQVAGYFVKPVDCFELIASIINYWKNSELADLQEAE
jgi:CheY-like chemotaxis protein